MARHKDTGEQKCFVFFILYCDTLQRFQTFSDKHLIANLLISCELCEQHCTVSNVVEFSVSEWSRLLYDIFVVCNKYVISESK